MFSAVVYTTGRTGSYLICNNLASAFGVLVQDAESYDGSRGIVHCHDPLWKPASSDFICVVSRRRDLFGAIMSTLVGRATDEFVEYSTTAPPKISVSVKDFQACFWFMRCFYHVIPVEHYHRVINIDFDIMMRKPAYLFKRFGLVRDTDYTLSTRAPWRYQDIIENHRELRDVYDSIRNLAVTDELIASFQSSIQQDLKRIHNHTTGTI